MQAPFPVFSHLIFCQPVNVHFCLYLTQTPLNKNNKKQTDIHLRGLLGLCWAAISLVQDGKSGWVKKNSFGFQPEKVWQNSWFIEFLLPVACVPGSAMLQNLKDFCFSNYFYRLLDNAN